MDYKKSPLKKWDLKYASSDGIHVPFLRKQFPHVKSKVRLYIDNLQKEDRERRNKSRSEPFNLDAVEHEVNENKFLDSEIDLELMLKRKEFEVNQMRSLVDEYKLCGDKACEMLFSERQRNSELQCKLEILRFTLHENRIKLSDEADFKSYPKKENTSIAMFGNDEICYSFTDAKVYNEHPYRNTECFEDDILSISSEYIGDNDETILLQASETTFGRKR